METPMVHLSSGDRLETSHKLVSFVCLKLVCAQVLPTDTSPTFTHYFLSVPFSCRGGFVSGFIILSERNKAWDISQVQTF